MVRVRVGVRVEVGITRLREKLVAEKGYGQGQGQE